MARPSVKEERTEEILQAYEKCVALYGVEGATQQRIAEEAGIARPLLRHHVGNSDDLLKMSVKRFVDRSEKAMAEMYAYLPKNVNGETFVGSLFQPSSSKEQHNDVMIAAAFIYAAQTNKEIKEQMQLWLSRFVEGFTSQLQNIYPNVESDRVKSVSAGIIGIYFNVESIAPLGANKPFIDNSRQAALYLLQALTYEGNCS